MISARLSRALHSALGEDAASGMVTWMQTVDDHRSELRELNELTVARLEARIGQVETKFDAGLRVGLKGLEAKIDQRFGDLIKWSVLFWCWAVVAAIFARA